MSIDTSIILNQSGTPIHMYLVFDPRLMLIIQLVWGTDHIAGFARSCSKQPL